MKINAAPSSFVIQPAAFDFFPITAIKPTGWLRRQLRIQADGLSGHLDQFWPDIADSRWIGGSHEGWERVPYWLDGFIPLAWLLDDADLKSRACRYIEQILLRQEEDGWICPCSREERAAYDVWALFLILKTLTVYADATDDPRIEPAVEKALLNLDRHMDGHTLFGWGQTRWYEALISIIWLYRRRPADWLVKLAVKLHSQGADYPALYDIWPYRQPEEAGRWNYLTHVVNQAMMLKGWSLYSLISAREEDRTAARRMLDLLDRYHGQVHGLFSGDECLAGTSPIRGTELCAVVEFMYSMEQLLAATGDPYWGDRLERAAFNALPATFDPSMWTHQYDQQVNQINCSTQAKPVFGTNGPQANLFGLEPNYGCCTANLSQGWPKFARSLFMRRDREGECPVLAVVAYAPAELAAEVAGQPVHIRMQTDYPFREEIVLEIEAGPNCRFALDLRIPGWAEAPVLTVRTTGDGAAAEEEFRPVAGSLHRVERRWAAHTTIILRLPSRPVWLERPNRMTALVRGPLVYAWPVAEQWQPINQDLPGHEMPHGDYEVLPAGQWQYGIKLEQAVESEAIKWEEKAVGECPFSPDGAPVAATIKARPVDWPVVDGSAAPQPADRAPIGPPEALRLIPYGCTNLRLTEFPLLD